eukprot:c13919_g1_i1.p3 GENE.c13919_g1_i1~~c13919_g1_i1.p3  ORF type:complete len:185 (+),score=20.67 c13919_g1_i1:373-927(+)
MPSASACSECFSFSVTRVSPEIAFAPCPCTAPALPSPPHELCLVFRSRVETICASLFDQGHAGAQNNIGCMYRDGEGVPRSDPEALMWFTLAASQGHVQGQNSLGHLIFLGHGTSQCDTLAVYWWTKSANQGNHVAQTNLGFMLESGRGAERDAAKAIEWYKRAAALGNDRAGQRLTALGIESD